MHNLYALQREADNRQRNRQGGPDFRQRRADLRALLRLVRARQDDLAAAISADFGHRSIHETLVAEIYTTVAGIRHALRHLRSWMRPRRVAVPMEFLPARARVICQPLGVVGIVSPWNYPVYLSLAPLTAALAAGNRVMIKPSEYVPRTSALLAEMLSSVFEESRVAVVTGEATVGAAFTSLPFDHLLFTGATAVGRQVMTAAAANLTPVTLELGGKCPAIIAEDYSLETAARSIVMGKMINAGQTCVAPDYVVVPRESEARFVESIRRVFAKMYPTIDGNPDYTSIAGVRHRRRLQALVDDAKAKGATIVAFGEVADGSDGEGGRMPLTLVLNPRDDMTVMQEEIFGPVLPVLGHDGIGDAIAQVNARPRPLALYLFSHDRSSQEQVLDKTVSGGVTINDTLLHLGVEGMPFGGVGPSGMGAYHGRHGFTTFSKEKPVFYQSRLNGTGLLMHAPFGTTAGRLVRLLIGI